MKTNIDFANLLETYFTDRLQRQRQASPHTVASYRDTFCLLLRYARQYINKMPSQITLEDLDAPFIGAFLDYLEKERGNRARSRNARLGAIHSFFRFVALHDPAHSALIQRVLAIPSKRYEKKTIEYLSRPEINALLAAPDQRTWTGRRDRTLLLVAIQTGLRVSEMIQLCCHDIELGRGAHVRCRGKGRKERCTPLRQETVLALRAWLRERQGNSSDPLFPSVRGGPLSPDGIAYLLAKHVAIAKQHCPALAKKRVSPHVLRHSAAMELLLHGIDRSVIALWLGHESVQTTEMYLHADMKMKEDTLAKIPPLNVSPGRYRPDDELLAFLKSL